MVVVGGSVYDENVGKTIVTDTAEIYNIEANTWSYGEDIYKYPIPARNMACVTWNGWGKSKLACIGGLMDKTLVDPNTNRQAMRHSYELIWNIGWKRLRSDTFPNADALGNANVGPMGRPVAIVYNEE